MATINYKIDNQTNNCLDELGDNLVEKGINIKSKADKLTFAVHQTNRMYQIFKKYDIYDLESLIVKLDAFKQE